MRDLKYLLAYTVPLFTLLALTLQGIWSYSTLIYAFVAIPFMETFIFTNNGGNLTEEEREYREASKVFDWLLYLNFPIIIGLLIYYL
ncbi:MAG: hypothetical protein AAFO82_01235 [Bacteroidota bacterium]